MLYSQVQINTCSKISIVFMSCNNVDLIAPTKVKHCTFFILCHKKKSDCSTNLRAPTARRYDNAKLL